MENSQPKACCPRCKKDADRYPRNDFQKKVIAKIVKWVTNNTYTVWRYRCLNCNKTFLKSIEIILKKHSSVENTA
jgi:hypothetical protein